MSHGRGAHTPDWTFAKVRSERALVRTKSQDTVSLEKKAKAQP